MKLILINLGKAWSTLRREGVWRGGRRILAAAWSLVPRKLSGDILIVTSGVGDSARGAPTPGLCGGGDDAA